MRPREHLIPTAVAVAVAAAASPALATEPPVAPPPPAHGSPRIDVIPAAPSIFTYRVDGRCRVERTRKLQGPREVRWRDAKESLGIVREEIVFRYVDGQRVQLRERLIKLLGEMVREGVLVCRVRPSGAVVEAWIERHDGNAARREAPRREPLTIRRGRIPDLGTYSVSFQP